MFVELDNQYRFVQYHEQIVTVSVEHTDFVIKITDDLYEVLQQKMPWQLTNFDANKIYDIADEALFVEIVVTPQPSEIELLKQQLHQMQVEKDALAETLDMILVDVLPSLMP